ncbi:MAG: hypothetical protein M1832_000778 [Thelocarpon impressellum]|nr:MAG: hypothetical protein M1832_000778 [Thelocarpon impressellum]
MAFRHSSCAGYQPCDSYFVESDGGFLPTQLDARERARHLARERQLVIAEELSTVTSEAYQADVLRHMEHMELNTLPDVASIDIQSEIQWFMRPYLLDFLIEAHAAFQLLPETLFLAVNLLDRYCSRRVVYKRHYQLVGCASLLIAAKYGDRKDRVPTIRELKSMCCSLYDDDMFTQMEWHVLQTLDWLIGHPTVDGFLQMALSDAPYDHEVEHMSWYICEIAMFHKDFVSTKPSVMARSALALARCILGRREPAFSAWAADYDSMTMVSLSQQLHRPSQVLSKKYASSHFSSVAATMETFLARQASIARSYAPPTPPCDRSMAAEQKQYPGQGTPHTPQKGQAPPVPNGVLTPPITPDGEYFGAGVYPKHAGVGPPHRPATPSSLRDHQRGADLEARQQQTMF